MTRSRWTLWTAVILLAGCLVGLDAYLRLRDSGTTSRSAVLSAMPSDASAVIFADLTELRGVPFTTEFYNWIPKGQADAEDSQFLRDTGFDYELSRLKKTASCLRLRRDASIATRSKHTRPGRAFAKTAVDERFSPCRWAIQATRSLLCS